MVSQINRMEKNIDWKIATINKKKIFISPYLFRYFKRSIYKQLKEGFNDEGGNSKYKGNVSET